MNTTNDTIKKLLALKESLSPACTLSNLTRLEFAFFSYQELVQGNPAINCTAVWSKIAAISENAASWKESKKYFKEAIAFFQLELTTAIQLFSTGCTADKAGAQ